FLSLKDRGIRCDRGTLRFMHHFNDRRNHPFDFPFRYVYRLFEGDPKGERSERTERLSTRQSFIMLDPFVLLFFGQLDERKHANERILLRFETLTDSFKSSLLF